MLPEFIHQRLVRAPRWARQLGLAYEHVALAARAKRVASAWSSHLAASRDAILAGVARCPYRRRALVIGAGACRDVPVAELADRFDEVVLADVVLGITARRWARQRRGRVRLLAWDATGALASLAARRFELDAAGVEHLFRAADPGAPPGGEFDFVASVNCVSQLGLVPAHRVPATEEDESWCDRCAAAAAQRHLAWLDARPSTVVLLADLARLDLAPGGQELKREAVGPGHGLRAPDQQWRWNLAPIPEWSRRFHRVHEVGAWLGGLKHSSRPE